jgi:hypothetical protein
MTRYAPESDIGQRTKGFYELWPRHDSSDTTRQLSCLIVENAPHNQLGQPKEAVIA